MRLFGLFLSYLPLRVFYGFSDFLAYVLRLVLRYRKEVVESNIVAAFPDLSRHEKLIIIKKFYRHFSDVLLETIQLFAFRKDFLTKRIQLENPEFFERMHAEGKSLVAVGGHTGNWEWLGTALAKISGYTTLAAYRPLANHRADRLMKKIRTQLGTHLIPSQQIYRAVLKAQTPVLVYLIADQAPHPEQAYWMNFLGRDTPVFWGPEKIARSKEFVVVYLAMQRLKRGHYLITIKEADNALMFSGDGEITEWHAKQLEQEIRKTPEAWLWSHKRWKHTRMK
jgi:KDO2-lipid IV(A) lauroyltransferase